MSADYWRSSQARSWQLSPFDLQLCRLEDVRYAGTDEKIGAVTIWMTNAIADLSKRLSLRQRVTATATVFFHRFYSVPPNGYCNTDPCLVASACVYVACKVEETPIHIKIAAFEAQRLWKEYGHSGYPLSTSDLAEMEFYLLRDLDYHLVLHHPYRTLLSLVGSVGPTVIKKSEKYARLKSQLNGATPSATTTGLGIDAEKLGVGTGPLGLPSLDLVSTSAAVNDDDDDPEERVYREAMSMGDSGYPIAFLPEFDEGVVQMAWFLLNDTYRHPALCLVYPPYILALAAVFLASVLREPTREKMLAAAQRMEERRAAAGEDEVKRGLGPTPPPDILTFLASLNLAPTAQLGACIQCMLDGYALWHRVHADIEGPEGRTRVMGWLESWRRSREEELRVQEMREQAESAAGKGG